MIAAFAEVNTAYPWFFSGLVALFGACVGSFLNVVIYRVPAGRSVVYPGSACACGKPIAWYDNLPVLSWCLLGGRSRCCKTRFSIRYPLIEAITALLFWAAWLNYAPLVAVAMFVFIGLLVPAAMIDWDTMEIPDVFSIGGFVIGMMVSVLVPSLHVQSVGLYPLDAMQSFIQCLLGGFVGSGLILWLALISEVILRKETMGFGDVKLLGAIGTFLGWQGAVFSLFGGAVFGTLLLVPILLSKKRSLKVREAGDDSEEEGSRIPFGPALVIGALFYALVLHDFVDAYFLQFADLLSF